MRNIISAIVLSISLAAPAIALGYGEECLDLGSPSNSILTTNSTFAENSWKVSISNTCSEPLEATVTYKVLNSSGFELDNDIAFRVIVPSNSTALIREIMLINPTSNANLISSSSVSLTSRSHEASLAQQCLRVGSGVFRSVDTNSTFADISLKTEIINDCTAPFESSVYFNFYDASGFLIDQGLETSVFTPATGTGVARTNVLLSSELTSRFATVEATLDNQRDATIPDYIETGRWLVTSPSSFDANTATLSTAASIDGQSNLTLDLQLLPSSQFKLNPSSIESIITLPAGAALFRSTDASLRIPRLELRNFPSADNLENVVLKLNDASNLTFDLMSFADERNPYGINKVDGADSCISIGNLDYLELSSNSVYSEISWKVNVSNSCSQTYNSTVYFLVHDDNDIVLDSDIETNVNIPSQSTNTVTGTILLSPPQLKSDIAKLSARLRIR